jgi:hypothetical protein
MKLRPSVLNLSCALALILLCLSRVCVSSKVLHPESLHFESNEALATYISQNPRLKVFYIADSPGITSLPALPSTLGSLNVSNCSGISSWQLPTSLTNLVVYNSPTITNLPILPSSLTDLSVSNCPGIESLPQLPSSLINLLVRDCPGIAILPQLPRSLITLRIWRCSITYLPPLPDTLTSLDLISVPLRRLPALPSTLAILELESCNDLSTLPELPASLTNSPLRYPGLRIRNCSGLAHLSP